MKRSGLLSFLKVYSNIPINPFDKADSLLFVIIMLSCRVSLLQLWHREIWSSRPPLLFLSQTECSYSWCFSWADMKSCYVCDSGMSSAGSSVIYKRLSPEVVYQVTEQGSLENISDTLVCSKGATQAADRNKVPSQHWRCHQLMKWYRRSCDHHSHCMTAQQQTLLRTALPHESNHPLPWWPVAMSALTPQVGWWLVAWLVGLWLVWSRCGGGGADP